MNEIRQNNRRRQEERSEYGKKYSGLKSKKEVPTTPRPNQNNINKHNMGVFYNIWKRYNEIQLTKNKMNLNNRKIKNHPPSPDRCGKRTTNKI